MAADDYSNFISKTPPKKKNRVAKPTQGKKTERKKKNVQKESGDLKKEKTSTSRRLFLSRVATKKARNRSNSNLNRNLHVNPAVGDVLEDINSVKNFFNIGERPHIHRLLNLLKSHKDLITWDRDDHEMIIRGRRYPGSNLLDILTYLITKKNNQPYYPSASYDNKRENKYYGIPKNTTDFLSALKNIVPVEGNTELLRMQHLFKMFHFETDRLTQLRVAQEKDEDDLGEKENKERELLRLKREKHIENKRNLARSLEIMKEEEIRKHQEEVMRRKLFPKDSTRDSARKTQQMMRTLKGADWEAPLKRVRNRIIKMYQNAEISYLALQRQLNQLEDQNAIMMQERIEGLDNLPMAYPHAPMGPAPDPIVYRPMGQGNDSDDDIDEDPGEGATGGGDSDDSLDERILDSIQDGQELYTESSDKTSQRQKRRRSKRNKQKQKLKTIAEQAAEAGLPKQKRSLMKRRSGSKKPDRFYRV